MKFRLKIMLCMLGLLSILFGAGGSLLIATSFHTTLERERDSAYNAYQMVLGTLQIINSANGQSDYADISQTLEQLSGQNGGSWSALRLYTGTEPIYEYGSAGVGAPETFAEPGSCTIRYTKSDQGEHLLFLSGALEGGDETLYLDMTRDISPLFLARQMQQQTYQIIFLSMAGLCALLSYSVSRVLTRPLERLSKASRDIAAGELSTRADIRSRDEIGLVAKDFNTMAQAMECNISELRDSVERQERFMGSFAHELKTPMTSIIGYADLIRGQTLGGDEQIEAANYIVTEGKRLENLSQKLLNILVLKNTDEAFLPVRPAALIRGLVDHLNTFYMQQGITLVCEGEEGVCLLEPDLVKSLLTNLLDNARKAMPEGGGIAIYSEMLSDGCRIRIRDSGCGIPTEALEHLTEAFYRVDRSRSREQGGVGLGLSLCREIVLLHNGNIRFKSQVGEGTIVTVELRGGTA